MSNLRARKNPLSEPRHSEEPRSNLFFFYGSLKSSHYNNVLLQRDGSTHIADFKLKGYVLYSLGAYPTIVASNNEEDVVEGEIWKIPSQASRSAIIMMEIGAGYNAEVTETPWGEAMFFSMETAPSRAVRHKSNSW